MNSSSNNSLTLRHSWEVILFHWLFNIALIGKTISGFYIAHPLALSFLFPRMEWALKVHGIMTSLLFFSLLFRLYYAIIAKDFKPLILNYAELKKFPEWLRYFFFLKDKPPKHKKYNIAVKIIFTSWALALPYMIITGFILLGFPFWQQFVSILGGLGNIRLGHYLVTWFFVYGMIIHIYIATTSSKENLRSIFVGYKVKKQGNKYE